MSVAGDPCSAWGTGPGSVLEGFSSASPSLCLLTSAAVAQSVQLQFLLGKTHFPQRRVEQGYFQSLLNDILNKELVLPINESEFDIS